MMEYRPITVDDVPQVTAFALRVLRQVSTDIPLHVAPLKVRDVAAFFARDTSGHHFNRAAFDDGACVGAVCAVTAELPFHERQEASVMFCFGERGSGMRLVRSMLEWFRDEMRLRRLTWSMNQGADFVRGRLGFERNDLQVLYK